MALLIFVILLMFSFCHSLEIAPTTFTLGGGMTLKGYTNRTHIHFVTEFNQDEWFGMGFGNNHMEDTYMILLHYINGEASVTDMWSTGHHEPNNITNTWTISSVRFPNKTRVEFTIHRLINTGISQHYVFNDDIEFGFIYAHRKGNFPHYHGRKNRFISSMFIDKINGFITVGGIVTEKVFEIHGAILYGLWGWMSLIMVISGRHFRHYFRLQFLVHATTGLMLLGGTISMAVLAIINVANFNFAHAIIGFTVLAYVASQVVFGILLKFFMRNHRWRTGLMLKMKLAHRLSGYGLIIISNANLALGLQRARNPLKNYIYIQYGIILTIFAISETLYR